MLKAEIKEDLLKELTTKQKLKTTEERLKGEIKTTEEKLRGEIKVTEERLRREMNTLHEQLKVEIHKWRADTIKWMFTFWIGQILASVGILKFMLK